MLEPTTAPLLYPGISMSKYGLIDAAYGGGPRYRLIWAPSRMVMLTGREKTLTVPMYYGPYAIEPLGCAPFFKDAEIWILEMWVPAGEYYKGTKEDWESDPQMLNMGPYPSRGDFVLVKELGCDPSDANVDKLVQWQQAGGKRRQVENAVFLQQQLEKNMLDRKNQRDAITRNAMRPWGAESYAAAGGGRNSKTYPLLKSREELGLPAPGATANIRPPKREIFEVMTEA